MIIVVGCSIKNCPKSVKVDTEQMSPSADFALCHDCEGSVLLGCMLQLEKDTTLEAGFMREFAALYNGWFRRRKGVSLAHRSGSVKAVTPRSPIIVVRGN